MTRLAPIVGWTQHLEGARFWRGRLSGPGRIRVERTVEAAEAFRNALMRTARALYGDHLLPPDLYPAVKPAAAGAEGHAHAFFLPEDLDGDGRLDHIAVASPARLGGLGLSRKGLALLNLCPGFWLGGVGDIGIEPVFLGSGCPLVSDTAATVWLSLTPFLPPLKRHAPEDQITRSLARLGFPRPLFVERLAEAIQTDEGIVQAAAFVASSIAPQRLSRVTREDRRLAYWAITFPEPVCGPMLLGGLSHFGLGRFAPAEETGTWAGAI